MKLLLSTFTLLALLSFPLGSAAQEECDCGKKPSLRASYDAASLVFVGRVESTKRSPIRPGQVEATFIVFERVKNDFDESKSGKVVAYSADSMKKCGFNFVMEQDYLVFATGNPAAYKVSLCSPTELIDAAQSRLDKIKKFR